MSPESPASWPADYAERKAGHDCSLCRALAGETPPSWELVGRTEHVDVLLDHRAIDGYCVVVWSPDHRAEPTELTPAESAAFWRDVVDVGQAIEAVYRPVKVNYMVLGNAVPHLHAQILPRHADDPAPGQPLPFAAMFPGEPAIGDPLRAERHERAATLRDRLRRSPTSR